MISSYPKKFVYGSGDTDYSGPTNASRDLTERETGVYTYICDTERPPEMKLIDGSKTFYETLRKRQWRQEQYKKGR